VGELRIGTAGWNYPRGRGTWNGIFYPKKRPRGFDELRYYAEHFDTVEVNSTFYGQPRAEVTQAWADKTPDGFEFSVKLFQKFTHPRMFADTLKRSMRISPADADAAAIQELAQPNLADLDEFKRGIEPLAARGRLGALLAQFPASFKSGDPEREYLMALLSSLHDFPVAVELRHRSWSDALDDTLTLLNTFQAAWVQIDEPKFRFSIRQNYLPNICGFYYLRLHGRNAAQWWRHDNAEDRYNYLYSANELREFSDTADAARQLVRKAYLYTNNHYSAKAVVNAVMLKEQLREPIDGDYPPEFVDTYPEMETHVRTRTRSLLRG